MKVLDEADRLLERAFAEDPKPLFKPLGGPESEAEWPVWRLEDLADALTKLEEVRSELPDEHAARIKRILERTEYMTRTLNEYRVWGDEHFGRYHTREYMIKILVLLRRLDPDRFPLELVADVTDEEWKDYGYGVYRSYDDQLIRRAWLAEFDPERFRRIFGSEYSPEQLAWEREDWERRDRNKSKPVNLKRWEKIEQALTMGPYPDPSGVSARPEITNPAQ